MFLHASLYVHTLMHTSFRRHKRRYKRCLSCESCRQLGAAHPLPGAPCYSLSMDATTLAYGLKSTSQTHTYTRTYIHRYTYLSIHPSIHPQMSIHLSIYLSIHQSIYLPVYPSIYVSLYLPIHLPWRSVAKRPPPPSVCVCVCAGGWVQVWVQGLLPSLPMSGHGGSGFILVMHPFLESLLLDVGRFVFRSKQHQDDD